MATIRPIRAFLKKYNTFLITSHINPEGDSLGSQLAVAKVLRKMGKQCEIVNRDLRTREYLFLPDIDTIHRQPQRKHFDAVIALDCSSLSRIGSVVQFFGTETPLLNIDHHVSNSCFGSVNVVDGKASSTCEMLCTIFEGMNVTLDKEIATCLFAGVVVDTGSFRYSNATARTHVIAARLLRCGIDAGTVYRNIYATLRLSDVRCIAHALQSVKIDTTGRIAWIAIPNSVLKKYKPEVDLSDNVLSFIRSLDGVEVCILFKECVDDRLRIRVNLRSRGAIDVNNIAKHFGGGGHATASGITLRGVSLAQAERKIIRFIKQQIGT